MSIIDDAFNPFDINRKPAAILKVGKHNQGWCECCGSYKPAPKKRKKGWRCVECILSTRRSA